MTAPMLGYHSVTAAAAQWLPVVVIVVSALWIARMHRALVRQYSRLQAQGAKREASQAKLQALLADLVATMNFSLASLAAESCDTDREHIQRILTAVDDAVAAHAPVQADG